jgi:hypothetical protein
MSEDTVNRIKAMIETRRRSGDTVPSHPAD